MLKQLFKTTPKLKLEVEKFKYSKKYGVYASNFGKIIAPDGTQFKQYKSTTDRGDYIVKHCGIGIKVYKIVADAWYGEMPTGYSVDHIDGNRYNNRIDNLEYVPIIENESRNQSMLSDALVVDSDTTAVKTPAVSKANTPSVPKVNAPSDSKANDKANMPSEKVSNKELIKLVKQGELDIVETTAEGNTKVYSWKWLCNQISDKAARANIVNSAVCHARLKQTGKTYNIMYKLTSRC